MSEKGKSRLPQPKRQKKLVDNDFIQTGVFCILHWQLSPTQIKCTYNASDSTYILLNCLIKMGHNMGSV